MRLFSRFCRPIISSDKYQEDPEINEVSTERDSSSFPDRDRSPEVGDRYVEQKLVLLNQGGHSSGKPGNQGKVGEFHKNTRRLGNFAVSV